MSALLVCGLAVCSINIIGEVIWLIIGVVGGLSGFISADILSSCAGGIIVLANCGFAIIISARCGFAIIVLVHCAYVIIAWASSWPTIIAWVNYYCLLWTIA